MISSLQGRLLLAATLVLVAFLSLTGYALDRAFRTSAEVAVRDRLQGQLYGLLAAADLDLDGSLTVPDGLPESRFSMPGSSLYGRVRAINGRRVWDSPSLLGVELPEGEALPPGATEFGRVEVNGDVRFHVLRFGVSWESATDQSQEYVFTVAEAFASYVAQVRGFRGSLSLWLGAATLVLLVVQALILRWGIAPLRKVADEVGELETGQRQQLQGKYPRELAGLTSNINTLIRNQRRHLDRYRNTLDDLAHSLKTPLAVLRSIVESRASPADELEGAGEQITRIANIVDHQLRRAATSGPVTLSPPLAVASVVDRVTNSLRKVYVDKNVNVSVDIGESVRFYGEEGDLFEIFGNLLDNAFKLCKNLVMVQAFQLEAGSRRPGLTASVSDDGPGIPEQMVARVTQRGVRADSTTDGQGIGLAVVYDIVESYEGKLEIERSEYGGAKVTVSLPPG